MYGVWCVCGVCVSVVWLVCLYESGVLFVCAGVHVCFVFVVCVVCVCVCLGVL